MSKQSRYGASELLIEPVITGGANTDDWLASMRGMMLMYANGLQVERQSETLHHHKDFNKDRT